MAALSRAVVRAGAAGAAVASLHAAVNARLLRVPPARPAPVAEPVSVLLPVRDEAHRVGPCLRSVLDQRLLPDLEVLVLDDGSTDGTAEVVRRVGAGDPRLRLHTGRALPPGWLGKPYACQQLADAATGTVLVFLDADVVLAPAGVAATVGLLRAAGLDLVSPYPRQLAGTATERLVQPLLQWSWLTFLPLRAAERSARPSLAAANGQLLAVDAAAYRATGGHGAVRAAVLDDLELLKAFKRRGLRGAVADGTAVASCRMYAGWPELRDGYTKSLWAGFGTPAGAVGACAALLVLYVVPPVAALRGSRAGIVGYAAAVAGRLVTARRTGGRTFPDAAAHPVSVLMLCALTGRSLVLRRRGSLRWKGRPVR